MNVRKKTKRREIRKEVIQAHPVVKTHQIRQVHRGKKVERRKVR